MHIHGPETTPGAAAQGAGTALSLSEESRNADMSLGWIYAVCAEGPGILLDSIWTKGNTTNDQTWMRAMQGPRPGHETFVRGRFEFVHLAQTAIMGLRVVVESLVLQDQGQMCVDFDIFHGNDSSSLTWTDRYTVGYSSTHRIEIEIKDWIHDVRTTRLWSVFRIGIGNLDGHNKTGKRLVESAQSKKNGVFPSIVKTNQWRKAKILTFPSYHKSLFGTLCSSTIKSLLLSLSHSSSCLLLGLFLSYILLLQSNIDSSGGIPWTVSLVLPSSCFPASCRRNPFLS